MKARVLVTAIVLSLSWSATAGAVLPAAEDPPPPVVQTAVVDEDYGYLNLSQRGGRPQGGVDGDGAPSLQPAGLTATFTNFSLNGIPYQDWADCRAEQEVSACLEQLVPDTDGDGSKSLRELHPGGIGGDTLAFDVTVTNTSPSAVLTTFAFQSKFSESPALGSRIGDKLFAAERVDYLGPPQGLVGVKKNGTANGLFGGKVKAICLNSSDDYPESLNLGVSNETLECAGGRTYDFSTDRPVLEASDGTYVSPTNVKLPKGLLPGQTMTMRVLLDAGTDDGALQRAYSPTCDGLPLEDQAGCKGAVGPLVGTLANGGEPRDPDQAAQCLELDVQPGDNVLDVVNFGDVKIIRDAQGLCAPSFDPFSQNQFLTIPRRNWAFSDILDTRDTYLAAENPTAHTGEFSFLDRGHLKAGELNFFEILRGYGEHGTTLDPSCQPGGSRAGSCGGAPYVPWGEFYALDGGQLVRQEVAGSYGTASYTSGPSLTATVATGTQTTCGGPGLAVRCKTTDPFETPGGRNTGPAIGASARADFSDVVVIADDKATITNEGGQAGGNKVQFTVTISNTSPAGSGIVLSSFNIQTKRRGLTDINELDGTSILGRQDLRLGAGGTLPTCGSDPSEAQCFDAALGIGRFPNVLGNSLLSSVAITGLDETRLGAIKKNGTFQPLTKADGQADNYICIKSGAPQEDQDADETCFGEQGRGLAPGQAQSVRLELDYGDFRGLILQVAPGTLRDYVSPTDDPFGLLALRGDFDCRDQRRLPYCHPDLNAAGDWFTQPTSLADVEFVTVHQPGDAATVMDFESNFGQILAMAGFAPTAEFWQGGTQLQVRGTYLVRPGGGPVTPPPPDPDPDPANALPVAVVAVPSCAGLTCSFDGSGSSDSDGSVVAWDWTFLSGATEVGNAAGEQTSFTFLDAGTYTARLLVTDDRGATGVAERSVTVSAPPPPAALSLTATGFVVRGQHKVQLDWTGASSTQVDVYRNGSKVATVANTGRHVDNVNSRGRATYTYQVCETGTTTCSTVRTVSFS